MYENINKVLDGILNNPAIPNEEESIDKVDESASAILENLIDEFSKKVIIESKQNGLPKEIAMSIMAKHLTCAAAASIETLCFMAPYFEDEAIEFYKNAVKFTDGDNDD